MGVAGITLGSVMKGAKASERFDVEGRKAEL